MIAAGPCVVAPGVMDTMVLLVVALLSVVPSAPVVTSMKTVDVSVMLLAVCVTLVVCVVVWVWVIVPVKVAVTEVMLV